ncbi:H-type small acid-soluble spore protein, partial [Paenibacillus sp. 28ISP30-2]|nr:H-type small acid-soluble spore protein [Paenibacillus sp. 28ISP30-2]
MNVQRAQEIASSSIMANVLCDGLPIYIQHVNEQSETARIYALNNRIGGDTLVTPFRFWNPFSPFLLEKKNTLQT